MSSSGFVIHANDVDPTPSPIVHGARHIQYTHARPCYRQLSQLCVWYPPHPTKSLGQGQIASSDGPAAALCCTAHGMQLKASAWQLLIHSD